MNAPVVTSSEKTKNYSDAQVIELQAYSLTATHDLDSAKLFAESFGKSYQSVISKIKNLELTYKKKDAPRKKAVQDTKADLAATIGKRLDRNMDGLEKATRSVLLLLINGLDHAIPVKELADELPEIGDSVATD